MIKLPKKKYLPNHNDDLYLYAGGWNTTIEEVKYMCKEFGEAYAIEDLLKSQEYNSKRDVSDEMFSDSIEELDYQEAFAERTKEHINRVVKYGRIIGKNYNNHDNDKLTTLFDDYALMKKKKNFWWL